MSLRLWRRRSIGHPMSLLSSLVETFLGVPGNGLCRTFQVLPLEGEGRVEEDVEAMGHTEYLEELDTHDLLSQISSHVPPMLEPDVVERINSFCTSHQQETTRKSYNRSVRLYLEYWRQKGTPNAEVTSEGVALFLGETMAVGFATLNQYLKGLVDFHKQQSYEKQIPYNSLRNDPLVSRILAASKKIVSKRKHEMIVDGEPKTTSEITPGQVLDLSKYLLHAAAKDFSSLMGFTPYVGLQVRTTYLFERKARARAEDARHAQLADIFEYDLHHIGPDKGKVLAFILRNGKPKKNGRAEYVGIMRCREYLECPVGATAFMLFGRWEWWKKRLPDFSFRENWYRDPFVEGRRENTNMVYATQYNYLRAAYRHLGLFYKKKSFKGRRPGGTTNQNTPGETSSNGQNRDRWTYEHFLSSRFDFVSMEHLLMSAGFENSSDAYVIPRARVIPSPAIEHLVWPWVEDAYDNICRRNLSCPPEWRDVAAEGFLKALKWLRQVFLQDAALLQRDFRNLPFFNHPLFRVGEWEPFAATVCRVHDEGLALASRPGEVLPHVTVTDPKVLEELRSLREDVQRLTADHALMRQCLQELTQTLLATTGTMRAHPPRVDEREDSQTLGALETVVAVPTTGECSSQATSALLSPHVIESIKILPGAVFDKLYPLLKTPEQVWEAWTIGFSGIFPPIQVMEQPNSGYKAWRIGRRKKYYDLKVIIDDIEKEHESCRSTRLTQLQQLMEEQSMSLVKLSRTLQSERPGSKSMRQKRFPEC